jgi:hypothetical protein
MGRVVHGKGIVRELVTSVVIHLDQVHQAGLQFNPFLVYSAEAVVKIMKSSRADYPERGAAAICLGILGGEEEGNKFARMVGMQVAKENV